MADGNGDSKERWFTVRRWLWRGAKLLLLLAVIGAVVFWARFAPVRVQEHSVEQGTLVAEVMGTGTLEARVQSTVSPKISGRIEQILVDEGDRVAAGEFLVELDDAELHQQVEIATAAVEAAEAAVERFRTDRERALAVLEQARREFARVEELAARRAASRSELDKASEARAVAEASLAQANAAINEAEKDVITAQKTLEYHRARLADSRIVAPFDGLIVSRQRDPGDVVVPGSPMMTLISTNELWISAWVDDSAIAAVRPEQPARVVFRSEAERDFPGRVARVGKEADRETREFVVDVFVLDLPDNWAVGQRAEVYIETGRKEAAALLPAEALVRSSGGPGVYVNADGRAEWRPVTLGLRNRGAVEILEGLSPGDAVVTPADPKLHLTDGRRIRLP